MNEIKKKIDTKLSEMNIICSELTKSLSELENMKIDIMKAESDFIMQGVTLGMAFLRRQNKL